MKKNKKKNKLMLFKFILSTIILVLFSVTNIVFIYNLIELKDIENLVRIVVCVGIGLINLAFIFSYYWNFFRKKAKKKFTISLIFMIIIMLVVGFINYNFNKIYSTLDNITNNTQQYTLALVSLSDNKVDNIHDIDDVIGVIQDENIENGYTFALEIVNKNNIKQELVKYETYYDIIKDLYSGELKYAFLPDNYVSMFSMDEEYADIETKLKVLHNDTKEVVIESVNKDVNKPFTILLMGVDTLGTSYNADTLLLVTFNPETLGATMLSIPRDTYTTIACTGGKHKINSSGWYSDKCVVDTVSKFVNIDIDYYAKINFTGIVDLVDALGGIDVDVVYPFCEQDSKRSFANMIYVEEGLQHLNGEQALALSRNRKFLTGLCPKKYNEKGYYSSNIRNDITRGLNQQLVLKGILSSLSNIDDLNTIYGLLDTIGNNVTTNMDKDTILSFYNIFKNIITTSDLSDIENVFDFKKLAIESYGSYVNISSLNLSMIIPHLNSVNVVSNAMKENLGLKKKDVIKTLKFNINNPYEEVIIGKGVRGGTTLNLLENLIGKSYSDAVNYCNKIGYSCNFNYIDISDGSYSNNVIMNQSPMGNYDMSLIRNKTITFNVARVVNATTTFDYSLCTSEEYKTNTKCMIPNFVNKKLSDFNTWYKNFSFIKVKKNEVVDSSKENNLITNQSVTGISIYDIYKNNTTIEIDYIKNNGGSDNTTDEEPSSGDNQDNTGDSGSNNDNTGNNENTGNNNDNNENTGNDNTGSNNENNNPEGTE